MVFQSNPPDLLPAGVILLAPGEGRHYSCGPMQSVFLADGEETRRPLLGIHLAGGCG